MRLLAVEAHQNADYYRSRYQQLESIGVDVFVLNGIGTPDFWDAERLRVVGSQDLTALIDAARQWHAEVGFDGVLTFSESGVVAVAALAQALGLPGVGTEAARTSRNKVLMRRAHLAAGVPIPQFRQVATADEAVAAAGEFGYPAIVKPTLGAASNFVFRVDGPDELRQRFEQTAAGIATMSWFTMEAQGIDLGPHGVLVESFLDGSEHLIEALAWDDDVYLGSIVDRVTVEGGTFDDDVHHAPTSLAPAQVAAMHEVVRAGARSQGLRRAVMHAEIRFHHGRPHLLEIAIRPGGGGLDHMARISAGYDPIAAVAAVATGTRPQVQHYLPRDVHTAAMCLLCAAGKIDSIVVPPEVEGAPELFFLKITAQSGDVIRRPPHGNNILGFLGARGTSFDGAMEVATRLAGRIEVALVPDQV